MRNDAVIIGMTDADLLRFRSSYIVMGSGCWEWRGTTDAAGYGSLWIKPKNARAHRVSFFLANGYLSPILDHLCRNTGCVNPSHLEAVDNRTNVLRGISPPAQMAKATHCKYGHEFTPENTRRYMDRGYMRRRCKKCTIALERVCWTRWWKKEQVRRRALRALEQGARP